MALEEVISAINSNLLLNISIILLVATVIAVLAKLLKQPSILAYIITGIILGPLFLKITGPSETIKLFSEIGIAFLLFIVGLSLNFSTLKKTGKTSIIMGVFQIIITTIFGFLLSKALGFSNITSIYISLAITFSSTIIIIKLLSDKNEIDTLYGKILVGLLLVQDFVAIISLIFITSIGNENFNINSAVIIFIKGLSFILLVFISSKYLLKKLFNIVSSSQELLFIASIAWCFLLSSIAYLLGLSLEIGAFLAGVSLTVIPFNHVILNKVKPLRDFFIVIFFVNLGIGMLLSSVSKIIIPALIISIFVIVGKFLILLIIMAIIGYKKRTNFLSSLAIVQISEFSLILINLGLRAGHLTQDIVTLITIVGLITITISSYLIINNDKLYILMSKYLSIFERKKLKEERYKIENNKYDVILFGGHRTGYNIIKSLQNTKKKFLTIDFNPDVISNLKKLGIEAIYGDVSDIDFIEEILRTKPKIVISTIHNLEDNLEIMRLYKKYNKKGTVIVTTKDLVELKTLYEKGADFVILPELLSGQKIADYLRHLNKTQIRKWGKYYYKSIVKEIKAGLI
ncbi:cation:proton antiporter [Candidatus Woesearchaeota archaeon]|nr:hypothetical protein [uncultured archaeon]AQS32277.1 hypothetical protein [uncultured archaeon]MBS3149392.1 cation:proton antiporter [Candidatus Woesearchaeota archaeon]